MRILLKRGCIEFKYYADAIHSGLTPPAHRFNNSWLAVLTKAEVSPSLFTPLSPSLFTRHQILYRASLMHILGKDFFFLSSLVSFTQLMYCTVMVIRSSEEQGSSSSQQQRRWAIVRHTVAVDWLCIVNVAPPPQRCLCTANPSEPSVQRTPAEPRLVRPCW